MERLKAWKYSKDYLGAEWNSYLVFLGQHRDSDSVTRSNFTVALEALNALPAWEQEPESRIVVHEGHWAVGWVEWIAIHESDVAAREAAEAMLARIEEYPLLNEEHHSELEYMEAAAYWARMSVSDRVNAIQRSRSDASIFSARRADMPSDNGDLEQYLARD